MPIEFRCASCGKLLRVGDDAAGRQFQCPGCQQLGAVPAGAAPAGVEPSPFQPPDRAGFQAGENPFQSPAQAGELPPDREQASQYAAQRLAGPALGLIITASLSLAMSVCITAIYVVVLLMTLSGRNFGNQPAPPNLELGAAILIVVGVLGILRGTLVIVGAVKMKSSNNYGLAMAAAIVAVIPCLSCWLIEAPFGVWALVALNDRAVHGAFRR